MNQKQRDYAMNRVSDIWTKKARKIKDDYPSVNLSDKNKISLIRQNKVKIKQSKIGRYTNVLEAFDFSSQEAKVEKVNKVAEKNE